jgi:hypothetical protein
MYLLLIPNVPAKPYSTFHAADIHFHFVFASLVEASHKQQHILKIAAASSSGTLF